MINNRIKEIRRNRGLSQQALADKVGAVKSQISKLEKGTLRLNDVWMEKLARALCCSPGELIGQAGEQRKIPIIGEVPGGDLTVALQSPPEGFVPFSSHKPNLSAFRVKGNSMSRLAPDGMYVVVDFDEIDPTRLHNQPVIVSIENPATGEHESSFKIYKRNPDRFEPYSIEAGYDPIFPNGRAWKIYGKVVGAVGFIGVASEEVRLISYGQNN